MGKNSTQILLRGIVKALFNGPKSISEIANATGFDRIAITRYLETLRDADILSEQKEGKKRIFALKTGFGLRDDTYFGLPLDDKQERLIDALYSVIKKEWIKQNKREPVQIQVQKTLYKVNKLCQLNLPMGWYLYGALCVKPYNPLKYYNENKLSDKVKLCIKEVVKEYGQDKFAYQLKLRHYEEEKNYFYALKEEILRIFYSGKFSRKSLFVLHKKLRELFRLSPKVENDVYQEVLELYLDLIMDLTFLDENKLRELQPEIAGSFEDIWKLIALYRYREDLAKFYPKELLHKHFAFDISQQEREIIDRCSYIHSLIPVCDEIDDPIYKRIKESVQKIKFRSAKEEAEAEKKLKRDEEKHGLDAVNKKLRKDFGF